MKIELNQDEAFIAIAALSKTIARKNQDLRRVGKKLEKLELEKQSGLSGLRRSVFQRKKSISDFEKLKSNLENKLFPD